MFCFSFWTLSSGTNFCLLHSDRVNVKCHTDVANYSCPSEQSILRLLFNRIGYANLHCFYFCVQRGKQKKKKTEVMMCLSRVFLCEENVAQVVYIVSLSMTNIIGFFLLFKVEPIFLCHLSSSIFYTFSVRRCLMKIFGSSRPIREREGVQEKRGTVRIGFGHLVA